MAGDVADQKRETAVLELDAVVEVAAEVESLLARAVDRRDVHARVRDGHDWQERLLEPADENLDLPVRVLLTLEQQLAGRTLELQLEHEVGVRLGVRKVRAIATVSPAPPNTSSRIRSVR